MLSLLNHGFNLFLLFGCVICGDLFEEVRDGEFLSQADVLVAQLSEKLSLLPPELRTPFHSCMKRNVVVDRVKECLDSAHQAATTPTTPAPSTSSTTHSSNLASPIEKARNDFKQRLAALRSEMKKHGRQSASFHEAIAEVEEGIETKNEERQPLEKVDDDQRSLQSTETTTSSPLTTTISTKTPRRTTHSHARYRVKSVTAIKTLGSESGTASPVASMSRLILSFLNPNATSAEEDRILERHGDLTRAARNTAVSPQKPSVQFFDVNLGTSGTPEHKEPNLPMVDETYALINGLTTSKLPSKNGPVENRDFSVLSPKIASVLPEDNQKKGLLSPSIFALYENSNEEQILPIPRLLKDLGLNNRDQAKVMEVALELAGARQMVSKKTTTPEAPKPFEYVH